MPYPTLEVRVYEPGDIRFIPEDYTDIADHVRSVRTQRGRDTELDTVAPGTLSLILRNDARQADPDYTGGAWAGKLKPGTQIGVIARVGATAYPIWHGYISGVRQLWDISNRYAEAELTAYDLTAVLARLPSPNSVYDVVSARNDDDYADVAKTNARFPIVETTGQVVDVGPYGHHAAWNGTPGTTIDPLIYGSQSPAVTIPSLAEIVLPYDASRGDGDLQPGRIVGTDWTFSCWFRFEAAAGPCRRTLYDTSTAGMTITLDTDTGIEVLVADQSTVGTGTITQVAAHLSTDKPSPNTVHHLVVSSLPIEGGFEPVGPAAGSSIWPAAGTGFLTGYYMSGNSLDAMRAHESVYGEFAMFRRYRDASNQDGGYKGSWISQGEYDAAAAGKVISYNWINQIYGARTPHPLIPTSAISPPPAGAPSGSLRLIPYEKWQDGTMDAYIKAVARGVDQLEGTVVMTWCHEPDLASSSDTTTFGMAYDRLRSGSAADFVAAWQHIHDLFAGITSKVQWMLQFSGFNVLTNPTAYSSRYPGDSYVDAIAWDPYANDSTNWRDPYTVFRRFYDQIDAGLFGTPAKSKPRFLGEYGCRPYVGKSGVKGTTPESRRIAWFGELAGDLESDLPKLSGGVYFDSGNWGRLWDWPDPSYGHRTAFKAANTSAYFINDAYSLPPPPSSGGIRIVLDGVEQPTSNPPYTVWDSTQWEAQGGVPTSRRATLARAAESDTPISLSDVKIISGPTSIDRIRSEYVAGTFPRLGASTAERVQTAFDDAGISIGVDATNAPRQRFTEAQSFAAAPTVLEQIRQCERGEQGLFFIDAEGTPTFYDRHWAITGSGATVKVTFGDAGGSEIGYTEISSQQDDALFVTRAEVSTSQGVAVAEGDVKTSGLVPRQIDVGGVDFESGVDIARWQLARYGTPRTRIEAIAGIVATLQSGSSSDSTVDAWATLEIGDRVKVIRRPQGIGDPIAHELLVEGIADEIGPDLWRRTLRLSPAPDATAYFVLDAPNNLDGSHRLSA